MPPEIAHILTKFVEHGMIADIQWSWWLSHMKAQTESTDPVLNNTDYISKLKKIN